MDFGAASVPPIEQTLQEQLPGRWRRASAHELAREIFRHYQAVWHIAIPPGTVRLEGIDHLFVVIDGSFPNSQPRILAPQIEDSQPWPHVEANGFLCLRSTRAGKPAGQRILQHLAWAHELLNYTELQCQRDFEREFVAYWNLRVAKDKKRHEILSLVAPGGESREIFYFGDRRTRRIVLADNRKQLLGWLRNSGANPADGDVLPTWLLRLPRPWNPDEYPDLGREVLRELPEKVLRRFLVPGEPCPLVFEVRAQTGPAFAAILFQGPTERELTKGFRRLSKVPVDRIAMAFGARPVVRCPVTRVDGDWVHGRGHDSSYRAVSSKTVVIVGCGALGGPVVRLLAQSGVRKFILIDPDEFSPANMSRHVLGMPFVGQNKARAMAQLLQQDFPHIDESEAIPKRFQQLTSRELDAVLDADLVISAGIDFDGDAALDAWRRGLARPPPHLCAWAEAHAIVGHAVLLYGRDSLMGAFDEEERPLFRLTDWPEKGPQFAVEAGCGNIFQPHGAVDLQPTIALAARLALDALLERAGASCRRSWLGELSAVTVLGGTPRPEFNASNVAREFQWS